MLWTQRKKKNSKQRKMKCTWGYLDRSRRCRESIKRKPTSMDWESVEDLSARQKVSRWIEEAVEILSRRNTKILMDWNCVNFCQEKKKECLDSRESIQDPSRSCQAWRKWVFQRDEKYIKMNATSKLLKHRSKQHIKLSTHLSAYMQSIQIPKPTHTLNKSNWFYISKTN